jgi:HEAT repeat protein
MNKKNTPEKTRQRTLAFVAVFIGFLGTSIFTGINVFAAHQKNQDFSQLDAEEKFSRLPEYLLVDRKLLQHKHWDVRSSTAKALGDLQSKEAIPELFFLIKIERHFFLSRSVGCSAALALSKLKAKDLSAQLVSSIKKLDNDQYKDSSCIVKALRKLPTNEVIPQLVESDSVGSITVNVLNEIPEKEVNLQLTKLLNHHYAIVQARAKVLIKFQSNSKYAKVNFRDLDVKSNLDYMDLSTRIALSKLKLREPIFPLFDFLRDSDSILYLNTTKEMIKLQSKEIIPELIEMLQYPSASVRFSAARILSKLQAKEAIPQLTIALNNSTGIERYKMLEALVDLDELNKSQARKWILEIVKDLEGLDVFSDSEKKSLAINILTKIYLRFNQEFKESKFKVHSINQSRQMRDIQWILTVLSLAISFSLLVLAWFYLRQLQRIVWQDHLICYFPEEAVSELIAFRCELTQAKKPTILIETTLLYVIFTLIWAFYIQINIDNLWLPSKDQRRR